MKGQNELVYLALARLFGWVFLMQVRPRAYPRGGSLTFKKGLPGTNFQAYFAPFVIEDEEEEKKF